MTVQVKFAKFVINIVKIVFGIILKIKLNVFYVKKDFTWIILFA
jgi:hypothetical protein